MEWWEIDREGAEEGGGVGSAQEERAETETTHLKVLTSNNKAVRSGRFDRSWRVFSNDDVNESNVHCSVSETGFFSKPKTNLRLTRNQ
jgi:hypothetical protein